MSKIGTDRDLQEFRGAPASLAGEANTEKALSERFDSRSLGSGPKMEAAAQYGKFVRLRKYHPVAFNGCRG